MVSECLPNHNDYKLNNELCELTSQKWNWVPLSRLQSAASRAASYTRFVIAIKHAALL